MAELSVDLNYMLNEMRRLRKSFLDMKVENAALTKQSEKQKQQLNKSKNRCRKLINLFSEKYRSVLETSENLKSEVKYLRQVVEDLQTQLTSQAMDLKSKDNLYSKLEEEMEILRSQIDLQADEHKKHVENILERNRIEKNREVAKYKAQLDNANIEIEQLKIRLNRQIEYKNKCQKTYSHPALSDSDNNVEKGQSAIKRRKKKDNRWSTLNITTSPNLPESPIIQESPKSADNSMKRKKLFLLDNDKIIDL